MAAKTTNAPTAAGRAELGQALADLLQEQARHNLATWMTLAQAVDWERAARLQAEHLRASGERVAGFSRRCLEISQAMVEAATPPWAKPGRQPKSA